MAARIAYVGSDRQLYLVDGDGRDEQKLTVDLGSDALLLWGANAVPPTRYSWPTWSPDGKRIACFELPDGDDVSAPARVHVIDVDGDRQVELASLSGKVPIYLAWRPDGAGVAILVQVDEELELLYAPLSHPGHLRTLEQGVPLFFTWARDQRRVLIHAGRQGEPHLSRIIMRDTDGHLPDMVLPQVPGNYCAPVLAGDHWVVHVDSTGSQTRLVCSDMEGEHERVLLRFEGLGAIVGLPGGERVLFSAASEGEGTPYQGAVIVDPLSGETLEVTSEPCLAFFWSAALDAMIMARVDKDRNCLVWLKVRPGEPAEELLAFWPSRELLFYLHFFDQFLQSHSVLSPDGRYLVFGCHHVGEHPQSGPTRLTVLDLLRPDKPAELALGTFGCFHT